MNGMDALRSAFNCVTTCDGVFVDGAKAEADPKSRAEASAANFMVDIKTTYFGRPRSERV
jgi:hypothetical protein